MIANVPLQVLIDSGASINVIDEKAYHIITKSPQNKQLSLRPTVLKIYSSTSPLVYVTTKSREIASTTSSFSCEQDFERVYCFFRSEHRLQNKSFRMADKHPEDSIDKEDNEELLLDTDTENEITFASTLMNINNTMLAMSESLKRLHDKQQDHCLSSAESAKKAKLATERRSESDTDTTADVRLLLESSTEETGTNRGGSEQADLLLTEIEQSLNQDERTDDPVSEKLANIANQRWLQRLSDDQLKDKSEKYNRPANCEKLVLTQVNPEIWGKLNRFARLNDLKLSRVQEQVTKVGHILVKNTEHLLRAKSDSRCSLDDPVRMNIDALALLGHAAHELTQRRRESIKPHLHKDYSTLCSATVPVTKFLFGDDLQTELTHSKATNKIGATASNPITPGQASFPNSGSRQGHHFFGRAPQFSRPTNYKFQNNSRRHYNQKKSYKRPASQPKKPNM